ncbi:lysozyme inhibitor LprI family protein [Pseudomonas asplenii]|uniref:lysozyme inhibitor LprI family protein n=1 Tax=Pseudomonas asplenii TaxID=53407 RepID=UPI0004772CD9|nr:lysozyme inhibitor LprI family protein [Pseudomonas fuscovaginae]
MDRYVHSLRSMLLISGLLLGAGSPAIAASFDCQKASTAVEKAICASPELSGLDRALGDYYSQAMAKLAPEPREALRSDQRAWLQTRNACAADPTQLAGCLQPLLSQRVLEVGKQVRPDTVALDALIASIPYHPAEAAQGLRGYPNNGLAAAWRVYLYRFEPTSGVTQKEAEESRQVAIKALSDDSFSLSVFTDTEKDTSVSRDRVDLTLLRMMIERAEYEPYDSQRAYVHCFIFSRQGRDAFETFGPLYGSTRDSGAPICEPQGNLFEQGPWKQLDHSFDDVVAAASENSGTIRFASYAGWRLMALQATVSPRDFLKAADKQEADPEQVIRDWTDDKAWPKKQRQQALAAIEPARQATRAWLQRERGLSASEAQQAAQAIVRQWLNDRLDFVGENSEG